MEPDHGVLGEDDGGIGLDAMLIPFLMSLMLCLRHSRTYPCTVTRSGKREPMMMDDVLRGIVAGFGGGLEMKIP